MKPRLAKELITSLEEIGPVQFGSGFELIWNRVFPLILALLFSREALTQKLTLGSLAICAPFVFLNLFLLQFVWARLSQSGIDYKRLWKWHHLTWAEIAPSKLQMQTGYLQIRVLNKPLWKRYLLLPNPNISRIQALRPEVIRFYAAVEPLGTKHR